VNSPQTLLQCFKNQFVPFFIYYPLVTLLIILPVAFFIYGGSFENIFDVAQRLFSISNIYKFFSILMITYLGNVIYAWARTRNPTYIKKQEAYEKWKAEKEAAKQKTGEQSQSKD
jgi:hypothetical protein